MHYWKYKSVFFIKCHNKAVLQDFGLHMQQPRSVSMSGGRTRAVEELYCESTFYLQCTETRWEWFVKISIEDASVNHHLPSSNFRVNICKMTKAENSIPHQCEVEVFGENSWKSSTLRDKNNERNNIKIIPVFTVKTFIIDSTYWFNSLLCLILIRLEWK